MFCGLLGGLYGASGASWGLLGALLELLEELQLSLTCTQRPVPQLFPTFPPCPAPQRTPARSTASRPAACPSALHRVAPRSVPLRAPPCPAPQRSSERFQKRFLHTSFNRARSSSSICAFRFPREVRFTGFADCRRPLNLEPCSQCQNRCWWGILESCWRWLVGVLKGSRGDFQMDFGTPKQ